MQLLNVLRGGTLHQHLPDVLGSSVHAPEVGVYARHPVDVQPGTRLADVLGRTDVPEVPTYHHQGIDRIGRGLVPVAWAPDGTVEALEDPDLPFCLAVQWHPEVGDDPAAVRGRSPPPARRRRGVRGAARERRLAVRGRAGRRRCRPGRRTGRRPAAGARPALGAREQVEDARPAAEVRAALQRLADAAARAEHRPPRPVPDLGPHALADQVLVLARDAAATGDARGPREADEVLAGLRAAL